MANEITVNCNLQVVNGSLQYQSRPTSFNASQAVAIGPAVGSKLIATTGTQIDLSTLTTPGMCRIQNLDAANYVEYGLTDGTYFYPLGEILPGETYVLRLYRRLGSREATPGTGSTAGTLHLMIRADTAACYVLVEVFNK